MTSVDAVIIAGIALLLFFVLGHYWAGQDLEREARIERLRRNEPRR